jgi:very-short-patch-repair endonuclease
MNNPYKYTIYRDFIPVPKEPHNTNIMANAEKHATEMRKHPSWLESKMKDLLDSWNVNYEFQKIFYMKSKGGFIKNYYIVDFFIPKKNIALEIDGKFHQMQTKFDNFRTTDIKKHYPKVEVIRWVNSDFTCYPSLKKLRQLLI